MKAFSQYLMRDDLPRKGGHHAKYSGFESGLRTSKGHRKRAYKGFRLALVADRASRRSVHLWGHVRPSSGRTRVTIEYRNHGHGKWHRLKRKRTDRHGVFTTTTRYRKHRQYNLYWKPSGSKHGSYGATTRVTSR